MDSTIHNYYTSDHSKTINHINTIKIPFKYHFMKVSKVSSQLLGIAFYNHEKKNPIHDHGAMERWPPFLSPWPELG